MAPGSLDVVCYLWFWGRTRVLACSLVFFESGCLLSFQVTEVWPCCCSLEHPTVMGSSVCSQAQLIWCISHVSAMLAFHLGASTPLVLAVVPSCARRGQMCAKAAWKQGDAREEQAKASISNPRCVSRPAVTFSLL